MNTLVFLSRELNDWLYYYWDNHWCALNMIRHEMALNDEIDLADNDFEERTWVTSAIQDPSRYEIGH